MSVVQIVLIVRSRLGLALLAVEALMRPSCVQSARYLFTTSYGTPMLGYADTWPGTCLYCYAFQYWTAICLHLHLHL